MNRNDTGRKADIVVIGAGASGLMAAISAAAYWKEANIKNKKIYLIDKNEKAGKKILATGNGRCNLTNLKQSLDCYMTCSQEKDFIADVLSGFNERNVIDFFKKNGMLTQNKDNYIYPKSMQAQTVADTLIRICESLNIGQILGECVSDIRFSKSEYSYQITTDRGHEFFSQVLILSTGSPASVRQEYNGYKLAKKLGHSIVLPLPALCGLEADNENVAGTNMGKSFFRNVAGVRCEIVCKAIIDSKCAAEETGELQLTDYGLSGIVIFCLSRHISRAIHEGRQASVFVDFLKDMPETEVVDYLFENHGRNLTFHQALSGIMNAKLAKGLINILSGKYYGISLNAPVCQIGREAMNGFIHELKMFEIGIKQTNGLERAQVCCGGVELSRINAESLESRILPGLYMCGELLDVDGICGGYNLQWAWSSGYRAGRNAAAGIVGQSVTERERERQEA